MGKNSEAYRESNSDHQHATSNKATALNASCLHLERKIVYSWPFSSRRRQNIVKHLNVSVLRWDGWIRKQGLWRHGRCLSKNLTRLRFGGSKRRQQTRSKAFVTWSIFTHDITHTHARTRTRIHARMHACTHKHTLCVTQAVVNMQRRLKWGPCVRWRFFSSTERRCNKSPAFGILSRLSQVSSQQILGTKNSNHLKLSVALGSEKSCYQWVASCLSIEGGKSNLTTLLNMVMFAAPHSGIGRFGRFSWFGRWLRILSF